MKAKLTVMSWLSCGVSAAACLITANLAWAFVGFEPESQGAGVPQQANGDQFTSPSLRAYRLNGESLQLDGRLDEPFWLQAEAAAGFTEAEPDRGEPASEETVFKVVYDADAIYFGVACYEQDVTKTSSCLARRDRIENSDLISIYIDPYRDKTTGYNFRVNPDGVQQDQYVFNDGDRDPDWDAVWEVETHRDARGWYAEFRIPFSSVRYRPAAEMTWGLQVYRWMHGRGEDTAWANWERDARGFVSRFGTLTGLSGIQPPRQLEIVPYVVQRSTDPSAEGTEDGWDAFQNFGADLKYGVTADLTLNATFQPDFGQVEADPALLNLSPFETFFEEKRPFFIAGARFFQHPDFNMFYSRRIGTGDENARIRFAGKLIGKTAGDVSVAALIAATDVTAAGQAHNPLKGGRNQATYAVGRFGKEFADGNHRVNFMQTAVLREQTPFLEDDSERLHRDALTSGMDFDLNFKDRTYNIKGSFVGTIIDPHPDPADPDQRAEKRYGTGGALDLRKVGGTWRGAIGGRWEHDQLDPNDLGILFAPDEIGTYAWLQYRYNSDGQDAAFNRGNVNLNYYSSWLYAGREFADPGDPARLLWSYERRHRQETGLNINSWFETRSFWQLWGGVWQDLEGTSKYNSRTFDDVRGPLMTTPQMYGFWLGINSDWRKNFTVENELEMFWSEAGRRTFEWETEFKWVQSTRLTHRLALSFEDAHRDAQWVDNFASAGGGIGGVSYVFGELDQRTWDLTVRSNILFSRDQSLEIYLQPFLTVGDYRNARELILPDSYDLAPYDDADFDIRDRDFSFGAVNLNMVYRWEYRPGSTIFLVWTHSRDRFLEAGDFPDRQRFRNDFGLDSLFRNEPTNTLLTKFTYWFSL